VVAYALAAGMDIDLTSEPLGKDADDQPVYLSERLAQTEEIREVVATRPRGHVHKSYADVFTGDKRWREIEIPRRTATPGPTHLRPQAEFLRGHGPRAQAGEPISGARVLAVLGDSSRPPHLSRGAIKKTQPGRRVLQGRGGGAPT